MRAYGYQIRLLKVAKSQGKNIGRGNCLGGDRNATETGDSWRGQPGSLVRAHFPLGWARGAIMTELVSIEVAW